MLTRAMKYRTGGCVRKSAVVKLFWPASFNSGSTPLYFVHVARLRPTIAKLRSWAPNMCAQRPGAKNVRDTSRSFVNPPSSMRSEEHTSELQSRSDLVCRLLLEKKKKRDKIRSISRYALCDS